MTKISYEEPKNGSPAPGELLRLWEKLDRPLSAIDCHALARRTGFSRRTPRKLHPIEVLKAFSLWAFDAQVSFQNLAFLLGLFIQTTVSKQAVAQRFGDPCVAFVREVLFAVLALLAQAPRLRLQGVFSSFGRVLIQDSTCLSLPPHLAAAFPGGRNQKKMFATLKIQTVYDLLAERFVDFRLSGFTRNDQAASPDILAQTRKGDLVLRDLGYFTREVFGQLHQRGAFFLSRLRMDSLLADPTTGKSFPLLKHLRHHGRLDQILSLGSDHPILVRVVAIPLPQSLADARRRKSRQNRDQRCSPSRTILQLMNWEIFITNVPSQIWSAQTIAQVYGLRWRIETIFKTWKSHFRLPVVSIGSAHQLQALIYARLLSISLFQTCCWLPLLRHFQQNHHPHLSLLKFARLATQPLALILLASLSKHSPCLLEALLLKHLTYEKRKDRQNFLQSLNALTSHP